MSSIPFLRAGDKILNPDGTVTEWFRNAWNALVSRTGDETTDSVFGAINGAAQARAAAAEAQAAADAAAAAASDAVSGAAGSPSFYVTLSASSVSGGRLGAGSITTDAVTATPVGGTAPYTQVWTYVSGDASITADSDLALTTTFTGSVSSAAEVKSAVWRITLTDSLAATASATVGVSIVELS